MRFSSEVLDLICVGRPAVACALATAFGTPPRAAPCLGRLSLARQDYEDKRLDINDYLVRNAVSTFYFPVQGDSMQGAEIFDGDILVVDRSVSPRHGHVVVAFINGERLVKRLHRQGGRVALVAEHPAYPTLELNEGAELEIWGVVVGKFKRLPT